MARSAALRTSLCLVLAGVAAACSSAQAAHCTTEKCAPPPPPPVTIHVAVGAHHWVLTDSRSVPGRLAVSAGRAVPVTIRLTPPTGAPISDVWVIINSLPSGIRGGAPIGKVKTLLHRAGRVAASEPLIARWKPTPLFGTSRLDLSIVYAVGDAGTDRALVALSVDHITDAHVAR